MDATAIPKGHILGWVAPSATTQPKGNPATATTPPNKNAKKRANARAKKAAEKTTAVKDSWEDEEEGEGETASDVKEATERTKEQITTTGSTIDTTKGSRTPVAPDSSSPSTTSANQSAVDLSSKLEKLQVK
jgi:partner of Y14 and mago protein